MDKVISVVPYTMVIMIEMGYEFGYPDSAKKFWFEGKGVV